MSLSQDPYPNLRAVLAPEYADLPTEVIEQVVTGILGPEVSAEDMEFSLKDLGRSISRAGSAIGRAAAAGLPVIQRALPGIVQGAMAGGPFGALGGALLGGLGGVSNPAGTQPLRTPTPPSSPPVGRVPPAVAASPSAQLLQLLSRPETMMALMSMLMGKAGRPTVPVGNSVPVPVGAFANTIAQLANQAVDECNRTLTPTEDTPAYLQDNSGALAVDPASPEARAQRLMQILQATESIRWVETDAGDEEDFIPSYEMEDALYDDYELAELYSDLYSGGEDYDA